MVKIHKEGGGVMKLEEARNIGRRLIPQSPVGHVNDLGLCPRNNGHAVVDFTKKDYIITFAFGR